MLTLKEAIRELESGQWCSLRFITADVNKGSGGKVLELAKCRIARVRTNTTTASSPVPFADGAMGVSKNPNHGYHFTRNVELPNKQLRKVHPILITHFNGEALV